MADDTYRHEALFYDGIDEFLPRSLDFLREGFERSEPALVAVAPEKIRLIRAALNGDSELVSFADIEEIGRNPARIIPAWRSFAALRRTDGHGVRGIGEPVWPQRSDAELVECDLHEGLLNLAFAADEPVSLLCAYESSRLEPSVLDAARRNHRSVCEAGTSHASELFAPAVAVAGFSTTLPEPAVDAPEFQFTRQQLSWVRGYVSGIAQAAGLDRERISDLELAVGELAANSIRHGGGGGRLRIWEQDGSLCCEIRDDGHIAEPLVGRRQPSPDALDGRGMWLVNQLCDLVQMRSSSGGSTVRLHMRLL